MARNRHKLPLNLLLVVASLALGLVAVGLATRLLRKDILVAGMDGYITRGGPLGWSLTPGLHRVVKTVNGRVIYDVTYGIGDDAHRITQSAAKGSAFVFLGDSFTFGEGVADADTLPQAFADATGRTIRTVNLGVSAYSPAQVLRELELGLYTKAIDPARAFVLLTAPWHIDRVACKDDFVTDAPRYRLVQGQLVSDGQCPPLPSPSGIEGLVQNTAMYKALFAWRLPSVDRKDVDTYLAVVGAIAKIARTRYGVPLEIIYLRNPGFLRFTGVSDDEIIDRLTKAGAHVMDLTVEHESSSDLVIDGDGHPNGIGNRARARRMIENLRISAPALLKP
jgi:hypothetical protein